MSRSEQNTNGFSQALWLGIGQASAFLLAFISSAILSRYFDETDYGTYKQVLYVYTTLQTVFTAGLPSVFAYYIPRLTQGQGKTLVNKVTRLFFVLGLLFSVLLFACSDLIASVLANPNLSLAIKIFSPFPLLTIPAMGVEGIYTALKKTRFIAIYQTISKLSMLVCIVLPVICFKGTYISAIIGWGFASLITFLVAMWMKRKPYVRIKKELIPGMYKVIFSYSLPLMATGLVGLMFHSTNQFFISRYYGTNVFAVFSNGFIPIPLVAMVAGSVKRVLLPLLSKAQASGEMDNAVPIFHYAVSQCVIIIYPILTFCLFFATDIVTFLFSDKYVGSANYLQISIIKDYIETLPYLAILMAFGKSKVYFITHVIFAFILWGVDFVVVWLDLGPKCIAAVYTFSQIGIALSGLLYIQFKLKVKILNIKLLKTLLTVVCSTVIVAGITKYIIGFTNISYPILVLTTAFMIFGFALYVVGRFTGVDYLQPIRKLIKHKTI